MSDIRDLPKATKCSACEALIMFVPTAKSDGKKTMPVDAQPSAAGTVRIDPETGFAHVLGIEAPEPRYVTHFATCPKAARFRKAR